MVLRPLWVWRFLFLGFAIAYLASGSLQAWLPPLLPFLAAAAVEIQFFVTGVRASRSGPLVADRGPQQRDLDDFGWAARTVTVSEGETELVLRPGQMTREEIAEWLRLHRDELAALGPGHTSWQRSRRSRARFQFIRSRPPSDLDPGPGHGFCRRSQSSGSLAG